MTLGGVPPTPLWLDPADAATYAGIKPASLRVWRLRYALTTRRLGGVTHYDLHELAAVLAGRRVAPVTRGTTPSVGA